MKIEIEGADEVIRRLQSVGPREAKNLIRATVHGIAGELRDEAKTKTPVDDGDLLKSIKIKRERGKRGFVASSVVVHREAWYWRFMEYGQGPSGVEYAMFKKAYEKIRPQLGRILNEQFTKKFAALMKKKGAG